MTEIREIITKLKTYYKSDGFSGRLDNIIKELEAEIGVMQRQHKGSQDALKRVMAECAEETKRLDWFDENRAQVDSYVASEDENIFEDHFVYHDAEDEQYTALNIRDLIDKANEVI